MHEVHILLVILGQIGHLGVASDPEPALSREAAALLAHLLYVLIDAAEKLPLKLLHRVALGSVTKPSFFILKVDLFGRAKKLILCIYFLSTNEPFFCSKFDLLKFVLHATIDINELFNDL